MPVRLLTTKDLEALAIGSLFGEKLVSASVSASTIYLSTLPLFRGDRIYTYVSCQEQERIGVVLRGVTDRMDVTEEYVDSEIDKDILYDLNDTTYTTPTTDFAPGESRVIVVWSVGEVRPFIFKYHISGASLDMIVYIEYSNDGSTWTTLASARSGYDGVKYGMVPLNTKYVRYRCRNLATGYSIPASYCRLHTAEFYDMPYTQACSNVITMANDMSTEFGVYKSGTSICLARVGVLRLSAGGYF